MSSQDHSNPEKSSQDASSHGTSSRESAAAQPGRSTPGLQQVADRLHSASIHLLRQLRTVDRETSLTPERLSLLSVLVFAGPRTASELAVAEQVSRPAISRTVKALEAQGLVTREAVEDDRRQIRLHPTPLGRKLLRDARQRRIDALVVKLRDQSVETLELLARAAAAMEELAKGPERR